MSETEFGPEDAHDETLVEPEQHRPRRRGRGCVPVLAALVVLAAVLGFGVWWAAGEVSSRFGAAPDYPGPGHGHVLYEVGAGATSTQIGRELKAVGVVKSVDAFTAAARQEKDSRNIQVGYYQLKKKMKAMDALDVLVDPENLMQSVVVVPEGARVRDVVKTIAKKTDISKRSVTRVLADADAIGLPPGAEGNPEGYLFPATYTVPPKQTAQGLLRQMVAKTKQVEEDLDLAANARKLGYTPEEILTVASILEYEANRSADYPKVARVLYNRLEKGMALQLDSTVSYVSKREGDVWTTAKERSDKSEYNTYVHKGLPPGPIGSAGAQTIKAALNPAQGDWLFFVPDYEAHKTRFSTTLKEHNKWVAKLRDYCRKSDDC